MEFETWAESKGFTLDGLSNDAVAVLRAQWRAEENPAPKAGPDDDDDDGDGNGDAPPATAELDKITQKHRAEKARQQKIAQMVDEACADNPGRIDELEKIGKTATAKGWSEQATELAILRTCRASAPAPLGKSGPAISNRVLEAALCQSAGLKTLDKEFDERTLESAHRQFRGGLGIQQLLALAAGQNGYHSTASVKSNLREVMQFAFAPRASGVSTITIPNILAATANKFSREAFLFVDGAWREFAATRSVSDFKAINTYSLSGDLTYEELPAGGHIQHGTLTETGYTNQVKTYAKMLGLTRKDIINDDLGALTNLTRRMGRGGAIKLNQVVWGVFLNNSAFFTAGNNNTSTGVLSADATGIATIDAAYQKFTLQTDPDGALLGAQPAIMLVPPAKAATARQLMSSTSLTGGSSATLTDNPWAGMFRVVTSPYMQDSTLTGNSSVAWYLLANPGDLPVIEVAFLNGMETPTVETADADFNTLGIQIRGYHDFGAALQEYRGGVRGSGA